MSAARRLAETTGEKILVIDRRDHVAGNAYDEQVSGIRVHRYGAHIFHTNSDQVWNFLSRFARWRPYEHRVQAMIDGRGVPLPFNFNSIRACFAAAEAEQLIARLTAEYGARTKVPVLKLLQSRDAEMSALGRFVYDNIFLDYTTKLWGVPPDALQPSVTARVPIYLGEDDRYFHDRYRAMPADGFVVFESMLDHPNIQVALRTNFADLAASDRPRKVLYTGAIDEYFGWRFGALDIAACASSTRRGRSILPAGGYRQLSGRARIAPHQRAEAHDGGRGGPHGHHARVSARARARRDRGDLSDARREPDTLMPRYQAAAALLQGSVCLGGRLADYQYYNMDQACARGLMLADRQLASVA